MELKWLELKNISEGTIPLQTLRADIDYGFAEANTTYGKMELKFGFIMEKFFQLRKVEEEGRTLKNKKGGISHVNA